MEGEGRKERKTGGAGNEEKMNMIWKQYPGFWNPGQANPLERFLLSLATGADCDGLTLRIKGAKVKALKALRGIFLR